MQRALIVKGVGEVEVGAVSIPRPADGEVLIRTEFSCLSPGTEARVVAGLEHGAPAFPFIPGYAASGRIVETGPGASLPVGTAVFCCGTSRASIARCWGGHASHAVLAEKDLVVIPPEVGLREASATKLAAIAYHGVGLSRPAPHEKVAVVGLGPVGFLSALLHRLSGAEVIAMDLDPRRRALAAGCGLETLDPGGDMVKSLRGRWPAGADVVVDATGVPAVLTASAAIIRDLPWDGCAHPAARLLVQGSYAAPPPLPYGQLFPRETMLLVPRDTLPADMTAVLGLMRRGALALGPLLEDVASLGEVPEIYRNLGKRPFTRGVTCVFSWTGAG